MKKKKKKKKIKKKRKKEEEEDEKENKRKKEEELDFWKRQTVRKSLLFSFEMRIKIDCWPFAPFNSISPQSRL